MNYPKYLDEVGKLLVQEIKSLIKLKNKIATGNLYENITYKITPKNNSFVIDIDAPDYLAVIEDGRKPNKKFPPVKSIKDWIIAKKIKPNKITIDSLAFIIARSIAKNGIKPTPILKVSFENISEKLIDEIGIYAAQELEQNITAEFNKIFNNQQYKIKL